MADFYWGAIPLLAAALTILTLDLDYRPEDLCTKAARLTAGQESWLLLCNLCPCPHPNNSV